MILRACLQDAVVIQPGPWHAIFVPLVTREPLLWNSCQRGEAWEAKLEQIYAKLPLQAVAWMLTPLSVKLQCRKTV